jgi:hypothetical protein
VGKQAANESSGEENSVSAVRQWWNLYVPSGEENSVKNREFGPTRYRGNRGSPYPERIPDQREFPRGRLVCTG